MAGEMDLERMLAELRVSRRDGTYCMVSLVAPDPDLRASAAAIVKEHEAISLVITTEEADERRIPYDFAAAWLTLEVHSSLHAVGLTAAVARMLADQGVPCNVLAGFYHDHLLVPAEDAERVAAILEAHH